MNTFVKVILFVVLSVVIGIPATAGLFVIISAWSLIKKHRKAPQSVYVTNRHYYF